MCLLLCTFHRMLECFVLLIFICLSLPSSLVHLCSRVAICQLMHMRCVSCSGEHTCHLVLGPLPMCDVVSVCCDGLFHRNKIMKLTAWLTPVIYSAKILALKQLLLCGVCVFGGSSSVPYTTYHQEMRNFLSYVTVSCFTVHDNLMFLLHCG